MTTADERVARYVLERFRADYPDGSDTDAHLRACAETKVASADASDGTYGCDTGCSYATFEATLACPHHPGGWTYEYGTFGELSYLLEDLDGG